MVIVAGHITVAPQQRESYLAGCVRVVEQARGAAGCLDFAISADLVDPGRINVFERWESQTAIDTFRGSGPSDEQGADMLSASVAETVRTYTPGPKLLKSKLPLSVEFWAKMLPPLRVIDTCRAETPEASVMPQVKTWFTK